MTKGKGFVFALLIIMVSLLFVIGCGGESGSAPDEAVEEGPRKIVVGYSPPTFDLSDFYGQLNVGMVDYLEAYGEEHDIEFEFLARGLADHTAHQEQYAIIEDYIAQQVDYIVIGPTSWEGQVGAYQNVNAAGIPLVIVNFSTPIEGVDALRWVAYSHADAGMTVVNFIKENYPPGQKIAIIMGVPGELSDQRAQVNEHIAAGNEVIYMHWADFNREKAFDATERLLAAHPEVDIIVAVSSAMSVGAYQAVETAGLSGEIDIFGAGATIEELDFLMEGKLKGVWLRDPILIGAAAGEAITLHLEGNTEELERTLSWNAPITMLTSIDDVIKYVHPVTFTSVGREVPTK